MPHIVRAGGTSTIPHAAAPVEISLIERPVDAATLFDIGAVFMRVFRGPNTIGKHSLLAALQCETYRTNVDLVSFRFGFSRSKFKFSSGGMLGCNRLYEPF